MNDNIKRPFNRNLNMYRNYVCPHCFNQINKCVCKLYPPYNLILIDIGMQEIIRKLNNKGYITRYSCESHYTYSFSIYINFIKKYDFKKMPEGFKKQDNQITIRHEIKNINNEKSFNEEKEKYINILKEWVESLDPIK